MKKSRSVIALLAVVVTLSPGCKKWIDKYFPDHGGPGEKSCRITQIQQGFPGSPESDPRTGLFYYSHGKLDSVIFDISTGSAGAQFHYFKYNDNGRLIEYRADYSREEGDYYFIHNYGWEGGKITVDTVRVREAGTYTNVTYPEYDGQGRIIKETGFTIEADGNPMNEPNDPIMYEYDSDGNLVMDGTNYDDKTNYLRTSEVLMFTQRNYSKNNPVPADGYTSEGLPTGFPDGAPGFFLQWGPPSHIEYSCK